MRWRRCCRVRLISQGEAIRERSKACETSGSVADGEAVWFWRPMVGVKLRTDHAEPNRAAKRCQRGATGSTHPMVPGKSTKQAVNHCVGDAGRFRCFRRKYWCAYFHDHYAHTRLRVHWAPGIPRALCLMRAIRTQQVGAHVWPASTNVYLNLPGRSTLAAALQGVPSGWITDIAPSRRRLMTHRHLRPPFHPRRGSIASANRQRYRRGRRRRPANTRLLFVNASGKLRLGST